MAKRGRPVGHKLSQETKDKISKTKTGQKHGWLTKIKIRRGVKEWVRSPAGQAHKAKMKVFQDSFWNSPEGLQYRNELGNMMHQFYEDNFND